MRLKKYLNESGKYKWDGKMLSMPDGTISSMADYGDDQLMVMSDKGKEFFVSVKPNGKVFGDFNKYDKEWKNMKDFVSYLNKNKVKYQGWDDPV